MGGSNSTTYKENGSIINNDYTNEEIQEGQSITQAKGKNYNSILHNNQEQLISPLIIEDPLTRKIKDKQKELDENGGIPKSEYHFRLSGAIDRTFVNSFDIKGNAELPRLIEKLLNEEKNIYCINFSLESISILLDSLLIHNIAIISDKSQHFWFLQFLHNKNICVENSSIIKFEDSSILCTYDEFTKLMNTDSFDYLLYDIRNIADGSSIIRNQCSENKNTILIGNPSSVTYFSIISVYKNLVSIEQIYYHTEDEPKRHSFQINSSLKGYVFSSANDALASLKYEAAKIGFKLISKDSVTESAKRIRLYCNQHIFKNQKRKNTNKAGCDFYIKLIKCSNGFIVQEIDPSHKHEMHPNLTRHLMLNTSQIRLIKTLNGSKFSSSQISEILTKNFGDDLILTNRQIRTISTKSESKLAQIETTELIDYMSSIGGIAIPLETEHNGKIVREAVLTITQDELKLLNLYGDAIIVDGTHFPNKNNWQFYPITILDDNLEIFSAGTMFASANVAEVFDFLFSNLKAVSSTKIISCLTDEDSAIKSYAINNNDFKNFLCAWHKEQNFLKELNKSTRNEQLKTDIAADFKKICYSPSKKVVLNSLERIKSYSLQGLNDYIHNSIEPESILHKFSRAYIDDFTCGYNTTSPGESMNSLSKRDMQASNYSLLEMKKAIIVKFQRKQIIREEYDALSYRKDNILEDSFGVIVKDKIKDKLINSLHKSTRLVEIEDSHKYIHEELDESLNEIKGKLSNYYDPNDDDQVLYATDGFHCSCGKLIYAGIPCSHIIKKCLDNNQNPFFLIRKRFNPRFLKSTDSINYQLISNHLKILSPNSTNSKSTSSQSEDTSQNIRYTLLKGHFIPLIQKASLDLESTNKVLETIKQLDLSISTPKSDLEIIDAVAKKSGRPKLRRHKSSFKKIDHSPKNKCIVCDLLNLPDDHITSTCSFNARLKDIGKKLDSKFGDDYAKRCSICSCRHHTSRKCIALEILKDEIIKNLPDSD